MLILLLQSQQLHISARNGVGRMLDRESKMKDLGEQIDDKLKFGVHIHEKVNKAYSMLGVIKRNFKYLDKETFGQFI